MHNDYHNILTKSYNDRHSTTTATLIPSSPSPPPSLIHHHHHHCKGPGDLHIDTRPFHHRQPYTPTKGRDEYFSSFEMEQPMPVPLPNTRAASGLITADGNRIFATVDSVPSLTSSATTALSPEVDDDHPVDNGDVDVDIMAAGSAPSLTTIMMARSHSVHHHQPRQQHHDHHHHRQEQSPVRRCQSLANSPARVSSGSWGHIKSPAASFLARFGMPDHLINDNKKSNNEDEEIDDYMLEKVIGTGGFATVRRGYCISNGQKVAIKVYAKPKDGSSSKRLERELAIWKRLRHDHVLPMHKTVETETSIYAVCDYCPGGSLLDLVRRRKQGLNEDEARLLFIQLCAAIQYLHDEARVCHKDIKLENVLLDENNRIKLCDFGLAMYCRVILSPPKSKAATTTTTTTTTCAAESMHNDDITNKSSTRDNITNSICGDHQQHRNYNDEEEEEEVAGGSLAYLAPEQVLSRTPVASASSDMWSLGVLLYTLMMGRLPFHDDYDPRLQQKIVSGQYEWPSDEDGISADLRSLLSNLLQVDPSKRYTIQQVLQSAWCSSE
ncbi:kinase-like domain-containing protein [Zychaea mexicana]|uniref:kinase-like domain-containing protein n=1 Tax=Zychaea mexicana TaxID=64656 RepID=UPI0022FE685C|nr:kinase-like domain-containing protein [Zychaea mexicana]KAI9498602.1 kinase-like domain-containing protein [Zychaea mexicana]